jgi:hypothetical protein
MEIWIFSYARPPSKKVQKDYVSKPGKNSSWREGKCVE